MSEERKNLYLEAIRQYELGTPIMQDNQFDLLEIEIKRDYPDLVQGVGLREQGDVLHLSPMLSLDKVKILKREDLKIEEIKMWFAKKLRDGLNIPIQEALLLSDTIKKEGTPKFDGNAINLIYKKGILVNAISRSDEKTGFEKIHKLRHIVPTKINTQYDVIEVRGEVVIDKKIFEEKYLRTPSNPDGFANERNYVTGKLGSDRIMLEQIKELSFLAVDLRVIHSNGEIEFPENSMKLLEEFGFEKFLKLYFTEFNTYLPDVYDGFLNFRINQSKFRLDGFVIKLSEEWRGKLGFNDHDPNWALAIKFPPEDSMTTLNDIEYNVGTTGEIIPTGIFEPLDLDGTIVTRASLFNWGYIKNNNLCVGTKVLIAKAGDIIPQVIEIIEIPSGQTFKKPEKCPSCGEFLIENGIHLYCNNIFCKDRVCTKITNGLNVLNIKRIGISTVEKLYEAGFYYLENYFDKENMMNKNFLINSGFQDGRSLEIILNAIEIIKQIKLEDVINSLSFQQVGHRMSLQLARKMAGLTFTDSGFTKEIWKRLTDEHSEEFLTIKQFISVLKSNGVEVIYPIDEVKSGLITFEMTGTPPEINGLKVKQDYVNLLEKNGYKWTSLNNDTRILITNDLNSKTGKMAKVESLKKKGINVEVMTYEQIIDKVNGTNKK